MAYLDYCSDLGFYPYNVSTKENSLLPCVLWTLGNFMSNSGINTAFQTENFVKFMWLNFSHSVSNEVLSNSKLHRILTFFKAFQGLLQTKLNFQIKMINQSKYLGIDNMKNHFHFYLKNYDKGR